MEPNIFADPVEASRHSTGVISDNLSCKPHFPYIRIRRFCPAIPLPGKNRPPINGRKRLPMPDASRPLFGVAPELICLDLGFVTK